MTNYAYIDKIDLLHIIENEEHAKQFAKNGKVVATDFPCKDSYPVIREWRKVWCYGIGKAYWDNSQTYGEVIPLVSYPELLELYAIHAELSGYKRPEPKEKTPISRTIKK